MKKRFLCISVLQLNRPNLPKVKQVPAKLKQRTEKGKISYKVSIEITQSQNSYHRQCRKEKIPADLNELRNVVPLTSTFLLDHTNCNAGNCEVAGSGVFPVYHNLKLVNTRFPTTTNKIRYRKKANLSQLIMPQCSNSVQSEEITAIKWYDLIRRNEHTIINMLPLVKLYAPPDFRKAVVKFIAKRVIEVESGCQNINCSRVQVL